MLDPRTVTFATLAVATFVSEDLACIAAGLLIAQGRADWFTAIAACAAGIFVGDVGLYAAGRLYPRHRVTAVVERWFQRFGAPAVFISRFVPGFRVVTYLAAGALQMPFAKFTGYLGTAVLLWTVLLVGTTALVGRAPNLLWLTLPALVFLFLRRTKWSRWEFWPAWLAYLPVIPYVLWLALKHCSLTLALRSNPGMRHGGLAGESKSETLAHLRSGVPERVAPFQLVTDAATAQACVERYPVVLKPDVGERGDGVTIARGADDVEAYFAAAQRPTIVQRYVTGEEFGLFYERFPGQAVGRLTSITAKTFPTVVGDGGRSVGELIADDPRARLIANVYRAKHALVPAKGEVVPLVEIGSHCRGTVFLDGRHLWTCALEQAVDRAAKAHPGFYFGRFDVRAASAAALQKGEFQILELNGVGGEPAHIYDPAIGIVETYRTLFHHWRTAFAIGAAIREQARRDKPHRAGR